jgi:hypothetical protein
MSTPNFESFTVVQLKEILKSNNIKSNNLRKNELVSMAQNFYTVNPNTMIINPPSKNSTIKPIIKCILKTPSETVVDNRPIIAVMKERHRSTGKIVETKVYEYTRHVLLNIENVETHLIKMKNEGIVIPFNKFEDFNLNNQHNIENIKKIIAFCNIDVKKFNRRDILQRACDTFLNNLEDAAWLIEIAGLTKSEYLDMRFGGQDWRKFFSDL